MNGKFTKESRAIYDIVLKMQKETTAILKAGIDWDDAHLLAHKIAIDGLLSLGILKGDKDEILKARTSAAFFPHGLGHYLGMDTHDVGGNPNPKDPDTLFRYLRLRAKLPAGSVVTNEPGVSSFVLSCSQQKTDQIPRSTFANSSSSLTCKTPSTASTSTRMYSTSTGMSAV